MKLSHLALFGLCIPTLASALTLPQQQQVDYTVAPVHTNAQLQALQSHVSPLDALGGDEISFINSVTFDATGVTGWDHALLEQNLSVTQLYRVLALFGAQSTIGDYANAQVYTDTDRLLLTGSTLPPCDAYSPISLTVSQTAGAAPQFSYRQGAIQCSGNVEVLGPTTLTYQLVASSTTPAGLRFSGVGFVDPFSGNFNNVQISADGQWLQLDDTFQTSGTNKFQFLFSTSVNGLTLISPDPEILNRTQPN